MKLQNIYGNINNTNNCKNDDYIYTVLLSLHCEANRLSKLPDVVQRKLSLLPTLLLYTDRQ